MPPPRDDGTKVYIGNLDERTTKRDLEDFFRNAGPLTDMWLARSPPGFAFVHFQDIRDAEDACRDLDGREILGRRVRVELSSGRRKQRDGPRDDKCYVCGTHGHMARDCRERSGSGRDRERRSRSRSPPRRRSRSRERNDRDRERSRSPRRSSGKEERERSRSPRADRDRRRSRSPAKDAPANGGGDAPRE